MEERIGAAKDLADRIQGFANLAPGWNSHRAPEITAKAIMAALVLVDAITRRNAPLPAAAPTAQGSIALTWTLPSVEIVLLVDDESVDYSVARPGSAKVLVQGEARRGLERDIVNSLLEKYVLTA